MWHSNKWATTPRRITSAGLFSKTATEKSWFHTPSSMKWHPCGSNFDFLISSFNDFNHPAGRNRLADGEPIQNGKLVGVGAGVVCALGNSSECIALTGGVSLQGRAALVVFVGPSLGR